MKKIIRSFAKMLGLTLLHLLVMSIVVINALYINIDEKLAITAAVAWVAILWIAAFIIHKKKDHSDKKLRKSRRGYFIVLDILIIVMMIAVTEFNRYWNSEVYRNNSWDADSGSDIIPRDEALSDFDFAMKYLEKVHPMTIDGLPPEVEKRAAEVRSYLERRNNITGYEFARELESIFSMLGDGHTYVEETYKELHYMKHIYEHNLRDETLVAINDIPLEDFVKAEKGLVSYEREEYGLRLIKDRVGTLEGLKYLGIDTFKEITYNYVTPDGERVDEVVTPMDFFEMEDYLNYEEVMTGENLHEVGKDDFVRYEVDKDHSLVILTLDSCNYNKHYREVLQKMFEDVEKNNIQNIAVDLRNNAGGSSRVGDEFINYLDVQEYKGWADETRAGSLMFKNKARTYKNRRKGAGFSGNVYVLTSVATFSSAMDFAMLIQDNGLGQVIGESCGNMPVSCGEVARFMLPNSKLFMQISSKKWYRVDESKNDLPIIPDYECESSDAVDELYRIIEQQ
ncbi:MAG: hypothetical protein J6O17_03960 [Eubacterium sp.]|nr:hypothetical protein [Eubacterium sp.]